MNEKKVVVVIVEGPYKTTVENVVSKMCALIKPIMSRYGYEWKDFVRIIHIADMDGVFTTDCILTHVI